MTGYTVHTGSTEKFTDGWDRIFTGAKKKPRKKPATTSQPATSSRQRKPKGMKSQKKA